MLNPEIGETVEWVNVVGIRFSGIVTAILSKKEILVGLRIVRISDLTAIVYID